MLNRPFVKYCAQPAHDPVHARLTLGQLAKQPAVNGLRARAARAGQRAAERAQLLEQQAQLDELNATVAGLRAQAQAAAASSA